MGEVILSADKLAHLELPGDFCLVFDILAKFMSKLGYLRKQASSTASSARLLLFRRCTGCFFQVLVAQDPFRTS